MTFLILFFTFLILLAFSVVTFLLVYRLVYFRPVTVLYFHDGKSSYSSILPSGKNLRALFGDPAFAHLGGSYYLIGSVSSASDNLYNSSISVPPDFIIISRSALGRFRSVDLSDRNLFNILDKFKKGN